MGEKFNQEIDKIKALKSYSKQKESLLSDLGTAYISDQFEGLDKSLVAVKSMRKALRAAGYSQQEIEDYLIQYSYITSTLIRKMFNESIYNEDCSIKNVVEIVPFHTDYNTTDIIISELKSRPALVKALQAGIHKSNLSRTYGIKDPTLLKSFYAKYENIIND